MLELGHLLAEDLPGLSLDFRDRVGLIQHSAGLAFAQVGEGEQRVPLLRLNPLGTIQ